MVNIIKAEHQKAKRTMRKKFIWGFPLLRRSSICLVITGKMK